MLLGAIIVGIAVFGIYGSATGKLGAMLAALIAPQYVSQTGSTGL